MTAQLERPPSTAAVPPPPGAEWVVVRRLALIGYAVIFVAACVEWGVPLARELVVAWTVGALACASIGRSRRSIVELAVDWLPFAAVLVVYDLSRGIAEDLGQAPHFSPQLDADRWLFRGDVPTVWLQQRLVDRDAVHWWDVVFTLVYTSHFVVPFAVAGVLWARSRARFRAYARRFVTLSFAGVATFVAFPAAPPWLADRVGLLEGVERTAGRGWSVIGLDVAERLIDQGQATVNLVAAVPSLHAGYATLVALVLWRTTRLATRFLLVGYVVVMGFTLVATGEHYAVDIMLGWAYAGLVAFGWSRWERRRRQSVSDAQGDSRLDA